jgi:hypothetical protein
MEVLMSLTVYSTGARLRLIGSIHGSQTVNVLHFGSTQTLVDTLDWNNALQALAQAVAECALTHLIPVVTSDWTFLRTEAQLIAPIQLDPVVHTTPLPNVGQGGPQGATITASLIHLRCGRDGRAGRGKIYLPPAGEANLAGGDWDAAWLAALTAFALCLFNKFKEPGGTDPMWRIGVLSRKSFESVTGTWSNSFRDLVQLSPAQLASSMRTRKKGRGA